MENERGRDQNSFDMFGGLGNFGGFGGSPFGRNPFDDPFFNRSFGNTFGPSDFLGESLPMVPPTGPIIQELISDDDGEGEETETGGEEGPDSGGFANEPFVDHPDDEVDGSQEHASHRKEYSRAEGAGTQSSRVHTCKVSYGGVDGVYYSSSATRRIGNDGLIMEECKEADKSKGEATHRISRGLHDKGHSVIRKLNSDGKVDTSQSLHNLDEDELGSFEEAWRSNNRHISPWTGSSGNGMGRTSDWEGFLLPSFRHLGNAGGTASSNEIGADPSGGRSRKVVRISID